MKIVIMRHGQAEVAAASDAERALTPVGEEQADTAGKCLLNLGLDFDLVLVSPYLRTQQTADGVLSHFSDYQRDTLDVLVPESSPRNVLASIGELSFSSLLLVSHQPLVSNLLGSMLASDSYLSMAPASMALLHCDIAAAGCAELQWLRHAPNFERE